MTAGTSHGVVHSYIKVLIIGWPFRIAGISVGVESSM